MAENENICAVCAWRVTCNKKYSISGRGIKCADFVRDVSINTEEDPEKIKTFSKNQEED